LIRTINNLFNVYENGCSSYHDPKHDKNLSTISYSSYGQPVANTTTSTIIADTTAADTSNQTNQNVSQLTPADLNQAEQQM
jgi:hypothetical protein